MMDKPANGETTSLVLCRNSQSLEIRGTPLRLTRFQVVFEVYHLTTVLRLSEVLSDFKILLQDRPVYSGRAVVSSVVDMGNVIVCEAALEEAWLDVDAITTEDLSAKLRTKYANFIQGVQKAFRILPEFKMLMADMQSFLLDLRLWLDQVELGIRSSPSADRLCLEQEVVAELGQPILPSFDALFESFENMAAEIVDESQPAHRTYMKRLLHPLVLASPFAYRTFFKPLGYAGDYEMVNMILEQPIAGSNLFAKLVNLWFLKQPPAEAHRNRVHFLTERLLTETLRVATQGRPARILNLGCGPAVEVQRFLRDKEICDRTHFTLVDFNEETLEFVRNVLAGLVRRHSRSSSIQFVKKSVHQILRESGKTVVRGAEHQYDFVYCAGLFDYLSDQVCQRLMSIFYDWLAPGGLLLATNVHPSNPRRHTMEYILDWHLVYRDRRQLQAIAPSQISREDLSVTADVTGVNVFIETRKASHG